MMDAAELRERIRERLPLHEVMERDGIALRRDGQTRHKCVCPFHEDGSPSFVVGGTKPDRGHCFGCGWDGDVFAYWQERRGVDYKTALMDLAGWAGLPCDGVSYQAPAPALPPVRSATRLVSSDSAKPSLPPLRLLRPGECAQLAKVRGLSLEGVRYAAYEAKRIAACAWPQYEGYRGWEPRSSGAWPSWCAIDATRNVAEFRRLDNEKYPKQDGSGIKAWSTAGKNWPLGAAHLGTRAAVLLVEGGPDMLAAYHFLHRWRMLDRVAVVCMLGAGNRMRAEALPAFEGKRVRIMMDADEVRADGSAPGVEAAARWQGQLVEAGAVVETFSLYGLTMPDGQAVKDLNDLARCPAETTDADEVREAFTVWDF